MKAKESISAEFQRFVQEQKSHLDPKCLERDVILLDKKTFFFGRDGKFSVKFSKIQDMTIDMDEGRVEIDTKDKLIVVGGIGDMDFLTQVENKWVKSQRKRNEQDGDEEQEQVRQSKGNPRRTYGGRHGRKTKRRMERFIARNRDIWDFSDDEKEALPRAPAESTPQERAEEEIPSESEQEDGGDSTEQKRPHNQNRSTDEEHLGAGMEAEPIDFDNDEKNESDDGIKIKTRQKKRLKRKGALSEDSDDDDDFFSETPLTTPKATRVVSPGHATVFSDDDDETEDDGANAKSMRKTSRNGRNSVVAVFNTELAIEQAASVTDVDDNKDDEVQEEEQRSLTLKRNKDITSFFYPKPATGARPETFSTKGPHKPKTKTVHQAKPLQPDVTWLKEKTRSRSPNSPSPFKTPSFLSFGKSRDLEDDDIESVGEEEEEARVRPAIKRPKLSKADSVLSVASLSAKPKPAKKSFDTDTRPSTEKSISFDKRPTLRWKGLRNLGNTCYMNSSLQLLLTLQDFVSEISAVGRGPLVRNLVKVDTDLKDASAASFAVSPRALKQSVGALTPQFEGFEQRDAHEFVSDLIDRVHDELVADKVGGENSVLPTDEFFRMNVRQCLKCNS